MTNLDASASEVTFKPKPSLPPPPNTVGVVGWVRKNLFSSPLNSVLTLLSLYVIWVVVSNTVEWAFINAVWEAESRRECLDKVGLSGACWAGVSHWMKNFIYGRYPDDEIWRVNLAFGTLIVWMAPFWFPRVTGKMAIGASAIIISPFLLGYLFAGGEKGLFLQLMVSVAIASFIFSWAHVLLCLSTGRSLWDTIVNVSGFASKADNVQKYPVIGAFVVLLVAVFAWQSGWQLEGQSTNLWGGLFVTLVISGIGIAVSLPAGIVLALGRRSKMPIIRVFCVAFIELFRSVPLITVLFMAVTMVPLFLPEQINPVKIVQAIIAVCIFSSAYMAETVRGGLQAIPKGQYEAAQALGLNYWKMMTLIVMPQALKLMIPNIVGSFIGLLKDTTLVSIVGLYDLLLMLKAVSLNPQWNGLHTEPLFFGACLFFVLCFIMSKYSQHLERTLGAGQVRK
ncbi:amino acid ABC transporter permease [Nisaea acidiphila]|uniref:Amino acid ABC transporter permease n=1 Tax=Nisaea acidiphila TaxID=1862145 RepID=A0A9J7AR22_9PROT|nr:amino acid ABC transporter permease [Nisaea acidiphila]UUX50059.1 amino acid ABC transporter permease [Nisaea acidiphila]